MTTSLLADAFGHHVWATLRLIDAVAALAPEQLATGAPGTYGSILETLRHTVGADASYLFVISRERFPNADTDNMTLPELRATMAAQGPGWTRLLDEHPDPETMLVRHRDDGSMRRATIGIRLAQALHHGTDHRSQICTVLTTLGVEPPSIDVWDFGFEQGSVVETAAPA